VTATATVDELVSGLVSLLGPMPDDDRISTLNRIRAALHEVSPMRAEPVDLVLWVASEDVEANDYNPNTTAPPEMRLLEHSILADGFTQPVVTWKDGERRETVDGFHRGEIGRNSKSVRKRTRGYLPVTTINASRTDIGDRMAATIRHNRARGKHRVDGMSQIVQELTQRKWSEQKIAKELGMEPDEVLRLKQITGLAELFADRKFSQAWEPEE
jgi:ParB-like chromosome segregation protein Spo0J